MAAVYEGSGGEHLANYDVPSPQHHRTIHGGDDDSTDSRSNRSRDKVNRERDSSRSSEREKDRDHRDRHRDRSERGERGRRRERGDDDDRMSRRRDYGRRRGYEREDRDESRHRHRSRSGERRRSERRRSSSRPRSRSKSVRKSGFDQAPPNQGDVQPAPIPLQFPFPMPMPMPMPMPLPVPATRHARRVYVGGLPPAANEQSVATFFSHVMGAIGGNTAGPGEAVVHVYINHEKKFAFVEMRSVEEASNAMALDGIIYEGAPVKVRRPTDYNPSLAAPLGPSQPNPNLNLAAVGLTPGAGGVGASPDRIFVGGIPYYFTEAQIRELLESFGPLQGFDLVKDRETGNSKGYAFCVYQDTSVTDIVCTQLNGLKLGDKTLTVRRASQGQDTQLKPEQENVLLQIQQQIAIQKSILQASPASKVVCLTEVVSPDELINEDDYQEIVEDMRSECGKFGTLVNVVIPRPGPDGEVSPGVGKVFLEYTDGESAMNACKGLNGRKFGGSLVVAVYYPEKKFSEGDYSG